MHLLIDLFFGLFSEKQRKMDSQIEFSMNMSFKVTTAKPHVTVMSLVLSTATYKVCGTGKRDIWS